MPSAIQRVRETLHGRGWTIFPLVLVAVLTIGYVVWVATGTVQARQHGTIAEYVFLATSFISVGLMCRTAWSRRGCGREFHAWIFVAVSLVAFWLGEVGWQVSDTIHGTVQTPDWSDLGYLAYYPFLLAGLFLLARRGPSRGEVLKTGLDVATMFFGGCLLVWYLVLQPALKGLGSGLGDVITVAYPVGDLFLMLGIAMLAVRRNRFRSRAALFALLAALLMGFAADLAFGYLTAHGTYRDSGATDAVYLVSWFLFGLSAALEYQAVSAADAGVTFGDETLSHANRIPYLLTYPAVVVALGVLIWALRHTFGTPESAAVIVAVVVAVLAMARQVVTMREGSRLREARAVAASEERLQHVLRRTQFSVDHAVDSILWIDPSGRIVDVNEAACRMLEYPREELVGMSIEAIDSTLRTHPGKWARDWEEGAKRGALVFESEHRTRSGRLVPVEITASHVDYAGERLSCSFVHDITVRKQTQQALREVEEQLQQSQKMDAIGHLAGGIAHDFNNLLAVILGHCELVLSESDMLNEQTRTDVQAVKSAADRATALTRQILSFSRRQPLKTQVVDLNGIVTRVQDMLRRTLGEQVELTVHLDPDAGRVRVDVTQIEQAITNLAVNARDAMPHGGTLTIEKSPVELDSEFCARHPGMQPGPHVMLAVSDTGIGMDDATRTHAFEPFFTTKGTGKGTGLGLATVYGTVRQSNGEIIIQSEPGLGTTVRVYLPGVADASEDHSAGNGSRPSVTQSRGTLNRSVRILIVEDEGGIRELISRVLESHGYRVTAVGDADEAMRLLELGAVKIDLLLTDVILPGSMQGGELARKAVGLYPQLPVLYMSGYTRDVVLRAGQLEDGMHYLQKPFSNEVLLRRIEDVFAKTNGFGGGENASNGIA